MLKSSTSQMSMQRAQYSDFDFAKPLTLIISPSSRYQAMVIPFLSFSFMCFFLFEVFWDDFYWIAPVIFGLMMIFDLNQAIKYWRVSSTAVVRLDSKQVNIKGKIIDLQQIIGFDYKYGIVSRLVFKLKEAPPVEIAKAKLGVVRLSVSKKNKNRDYFAVNVVVNIGGFEVLGKKLKPEQVKQLVGEYIDYHKISKDVVN